LQRWNNELLRLETTDKKEWVLSIAMSLLSKNPTITLICLDFFTATKVIIPYSTKGNYFARLFGMAEGKQYKFSSPPDLHRELPLVVVLDDKKRRMAYSSEILMQPDDIRKIPLIISQEYEKVPHDGVFKFKLPNEEEEASRDLTGYMGFIFNEKRKDFYGALVTVHQMEYRIPITVVVSTEGLLDTQFYLLSCASLLLSWSNTKENNIKERSHNRMIMTSCEQLESQYYKFEFIYLGSESEIEKSDTKVMRQLQRLLRSLGSERTLLEEMIIRGTRYNRTVNLEVNRSFVLLQPGKKRLVHNVICI